MSRGADVRVMFHCSDVDVEGADVRVMFHCSYVDVEGPMYVLCFIVATLMSSGRCTCYVSL